MKYLLLLVFIALFGSAFAQTYEPLQSGGTIPAEFVTKSSQKYLQEQQSISKSEERKTKVMKSAFYLKSAFSLDNLLKSGYVIFNDPVTKYLDKVAAEIKKTNPDIPANVRFYTMKSTTVNAFSFADGVVVISLGLLAQLENEAQLAFILCHEISHVSEKHALENYIHVELVRKGSGVYRNLSFNEKMLEHMRFSKEHEQEADDKGFELFANTNYSYAELNGVFDVLQYAHLPVDDIPFNYDLLQDENLVFPDDYKITEVNPINTEEKDEDEESTHPSIPKRRQASLDLIKGKSNEGRLAYMVADSEFKSVRELARNELLRQYILDGEYENAVYHAAIMLKSGNSQYVEEALGRALYGLAFYSATGNFSEVHIDPEETEGYQHQVAHLFDKMNFNREEIAILALHYMLELKKKYPENTSADHYIERLVELLVKKRDIEWDYFVSETLAEAKKKAEEAVAAAAADTTGAGTEELTKYEKIKKQTIVEAPTLHYAKYALAGYKGDLELKELFKKYEKEASKEEEPAPTSSRGMSQKKKEEQEIKRKGYALNIDKVLIFDPIYALIDQRKKESYRYLESEKGQEDFAAKITAISQKAGLEIKMLDFGQIGSGDIADFNDFAFLTEYINERLNHPDDVEISTMERERVLAFTKKYGTKYVDLAALIYLKQRGNNARLIAYSVLFPFVLPVTIPRMVTGGKNCLYLNLLYNLETDELVFSEAYNIYASDQEYLVKSHLYHTIHQIKSDK